MIELSQLAKSVSVFMVLCRNQYASYAGHSSQRSLKDGRRRVHCTFNDFSCRSIANNLHSVSRSLSCTAGKFSSLSADGNQEMTGGSVCHALLSAGSTELAKSEAGNKNLTRVFIGIVVSTQQPGGDRRMVAGLFHVQLQKTFFRVSVLSSQRTTDTPHLYCPVRLTSALIRPQDDCQDLMLVVHFASAIRLGSHQCFLAPQD